MGNFSKYLEKALDNEEVINEGYEENILNYIEKSKKLSKEDKKEVLKLAEEKKFEEIADYILKKSSDNKKMKEEFLKYFFGMNVKIK